MLHEGIENKGIACTGLSLPADLMEAAKRRAKEEDRPFNRIVARALLAYLASEPVQSRLIETKEV